MKKQIRIIENMITSKELQRLFQEITMHLLEDEKPSVYLEELSQESCFSEQPFLLLERMKRTEQSMIHHPEGNVWRHTMLVLEEAAKVRSTSSNPMIFMWSALLHDIGKPVTTKKQKDRITSYDHDKEGEILCTTFLNYFELEEAFIQRVAAMVRYHMHILYLLKRLPYADKKGMLQRVDRTDIALLCLCDRLGRKNADRETVESEYQRFVTILGELYHKSEPSSRQG